jgi:nucleoside-diphosphate kinase
MLYIILFCSALVNYISSGPVLAMELLAPSAVASWRKTLGPTDSEKARIESPNSLRALFGLDKTNNAAHGSDSIESAARVCRLSSLIIY